MLIIVPTRSRPENVAKVVRAWEETDAFRHADLCFAWDIDDPKSYDYARQVSLHRNLGFDFLIEPQSEWRPLVPKLNAVAMKYAEKYFALGFAGDDHLPRTERWADEYLLRLKQMETGVVSCPDGYRKDKLPTQWAMTADIVRALGRMVPAPVEHLYCDNAVQDLAEAAGCYAYLDDVLIEHMHPAAKKTGWDAQYLHVNRHEQFQRDSVAYEGWRKFDLWRHAEIVRALRSGSTAPNSSEEYR